MKIFPEPSFTTSELQDISVHMTHPAVVKYLHSLAYNAGKDICTGGPSENESAESYLRRTEYVKGGIGVIETLLNIEASVKAE